MSNSELTWREFQRDERITDRIEAGFSKIDPRWRDVDPGKSGPRVTYRWSRREGQIRVDVRGTAVTSANVARFDEVILSAIRAEASDRDEFDPGP